jgi:ribosome-binding protein aMBF1 (putative translation factor)
MITNDRQVEITQKWIRRFTDSLDEVTRLLAGEVADHNERRKLEVFAASFRSQIAELESQITEYNALRANRAQTIPFTSINDLAKALIKARIAAGLSQADLAARLAMEEEELQRHESRDYQTVRVADLLRIAGILGIELRGDLRLVGSHAHAAD